MLVGCCSCSCTGSATRSALGQSGDVTGIFEQVRYLFPLLGLYAALIASGREGRGARFGRPGPASCWSALAIALSIAAQLTSVLAFYG